MFLCHIGTWGLPQFVGKIPLKVSIWNIFLQLQKGSEIPISITSIVQSRGSSCAYFLVYGLDTFRRLTCFWNSGLQISQIPQHVTSCEAVSGSSMFVPLLTCSLEGIPLQLWTCEEDTLERVRMQWALEWHAPWDKKGVYWALVRLQKYLWLFLCKVVYWLQPSNTFCFQVIHSESIVLKILYMQQNVQVFNLMTIDCSHHLNKDMKYFLDPKVSSHARFQWVLLLPRTHWPVFLSPQFIHLHQQKGVLSLTPPFPLPLYK